MTSKSVKCTDGLVKMIKKCEIFLFADDCKLAKIILSIVDCNIITG